MEMAAERDPHVISSDEKRGLILAHHDARQKHGTPTAFVFYAGIAASCLVVFVGYAMTIGKTFQSNLQIRQDPAVQVLTKSIEDAQKNWPATPQIPDNQQIKQTVQDVIQQIQQPASTSSNP